MNGIARFIIVIGLIVGIAPLFAEEKMQNKVMEPWIGIVQAKAGEKLYLEKLKAFSAKEKFDWGNVIICQYLDDKVIFIVDAKGPGLRVNSAESFGGLGGKKEVEISPVAHFEIIIMKYGYSVQELRYVSGFELFNLGGFEIVRKHDKSQSEERVNDAQVDQSGGC